METSHQQSCSTLKQVERGWGKMKVIWWTIIKEDKSGQRREIRSKRHAVEGFSSATTYCGRDIPQDFADVYAEASQKVTCERCLEILEEGESFS